MQHRTILRVIDLIASEHGLDAFRQLSSLSQLNEGITGGIIHKIFRKIHMKIGSVKAQLLSSLRVSVEKLP